MYHFLNCKQSFKEAFSNKIIIEFPTIYVVLPNEKDNYPEYNPELITSTVEKFNQKFELKYYNDDYCYEEINENFLLSIINKNKQNLKQEHLEPQLQENKEINEIMKTKLDQFLTKF